MRHGRNACHALSIAHIAFWCWDFLCSQLACPECGLPPGSWSGSKPVGYTMRDLGVAAAINSPPSCPYPPP